jgi:hypothetical protein
VSDQSQVSLRPSFKSLAAARDFVVNRWRHDTASIAGDLQSLLLDATHPLDLATVTLLTRHSPDTPPALQSRAMDDATDQLLSVLTRASALEQRPSQELRIAQAAAEVMRVCESVLSSEVLLLAQVAPKVDTTLDIRGLATAAGQARSCEGGLRDYVNERTLAAADAATAASERAIAAKEASEEAAGSSSESRLSYDFKTYSRGQFWRGVVFLLFGVASAAGLAYAEYQLDVHHVFSSNVSSITVRAALALPFATLSGYCFREFVLFSNDSRQAGRIRVRIESMRAYTMELSTEQRSSIRYELGRQVFTVPLGTESKNKEEVASLIPQLQQLAEMEDLIKRIINVGGKHSI